MGKHNHQINAQVDEAVETVEQIAEEVEAVVEPAPVVTGTVTDCVKLNIRRAPSAKATVVCVIDRDAEVIIDEGKSNAEWYSVCTTAGVGGFCMKKYITISQ